MFVKTDFYVLKLKFYACNFKQAFYPFHELHIYFCTIYFDNTNILLYKLFLPFGT